MSSPVHHPEDLDPALMYAPPRVRSARSARGSSRRRQRTDHAEPEFDGDSAMLLLRHRLSLDPEAVPVPPQLDEGIPIERIAFRLCVVACVGALIAWALTSNITSLTRSPTAKLAAAEMAKADALPEIAANTVKFFHFGTAAVARPAPAAALGNADEPARPAQSVAANPEQGDATGISPPPATEPVAGVAPALNREHADPAGLTPPATGPVVASVSPALGQAEIAHLLERGKSYLTDGDIASARLLLQRAAEAGNAEAALVLGSTFDPHVIARLGAVGVWSDVREAREWYEKAAQLGSPIAARQLSSLVDSDR